MKQTVKTFISEIEHQFDFYKNPEKAEGMSKYMKNKFVFFGIPSSLRKEIQKVVLTQFSKFDLEEKWEIIEILWEKEEREFHYFAIDLLKKWKKKDWKVTDFETLEFLITQKSWWDTVDLIASNMLGVYFQLFPTEINTRIDKWRESSNIWLNRSCLIFQLKYKEQVNFDLLKSLILQFKGNNEFFIQKAIGWSLRSYGDFYPQEVLRFVEEIELKGLARNEAIRKVINRTQANITSFF